MPVGYPVADKTTILADEQGLPVAKGELGEVWVTSTFMAKGYWQDDELTDHSFVLQHDGQNYGYRTGDLAFENAQGLYEFVGRRDNQVKIRGYRVNLSELEAALRALAGVTDATALLVDEHGQQSLIAVLCANTAQRFTYASLITQLKSQLPAALLPNKLCWLYQIPRLDNFKVDQNVVKALLATAEAKSALLDASIAQSTNNELALDQLQLSQLWCMQLNVAAITDPLQSLTQAGADSLTSLNLLAALEKLTGRTLPLTLVNKHQHFMGLLSALRSLEQTGNKPVLYLVPPRNGLRGMGAIAAALAEHMQIKSISIAAIYSDDKNEQPEQIANRLVSYLCQYHTGGPISLFGLSGGVKPAFIAAHVLALQGFAMGSLLLGDYGPAVAPAAFAQTAWPNYNGKVIEVIASEDMQGRHRQVKHLGWQSYATDISPLFINSNHVEMLQASALHEYLMSLVWCGSG